MKPVVVVGGYGQLGSHCVRQLLRTTSLPLVIAGPSVQRAEAAASALGSRVHGMYLDATDARTLQETPGGVGTYVVCSPGIPIELLSHAIESRTPVIAMTPLPLPAAAHSDLAKRAWDNEIPIVLHAGWAPGLAGVLAEQLARNHASLDEVRIASTGPHLGSDAAREDWRQLLHEWRQLRGSKAGRRMLQFGFPQPIGARRVVQVSHADLSAFSRQHTIGKVSYYELDRGLLARGYRRLRGQDELELAVLTAEAFERVDSKEPVERLTLRASSPLQISACVVSVLLQNLALGKLPAGVSELREAINPSLLLQELESQGASLSTDRGERG